MLLSIALLLIIGYLLGELCAKWHLPKLMGYLFTGILLGSSGLNLLQDNLYLISEDIRTIALVVILARAGFTLNLNVLKKVGTSSILMCFVPATFELMATIFVGITFFKLSFVESALLGAVLAAVSPAVVVPKMITLIEQGYGKTKAIPQMILAGASVDDVYVIVLFASFLNLAKGQSVNMISFINIPVSIILGCLLGLFCAYFLCDIFKKFNIKNIYQSSLILGMYLLLVAIEKSLTTSLTFSAYIAIIACGIGLQKKEVNIQPINQQFNQFWLIAQIYLFSLVGASVQIQMMLHSGIKMVIALIIILIGRCMGVLVATLPAKLSYKELIFTMVAYLPKATVQAAIGSIALANGLHCGMFILTFAVLAILFTAPMGALLMDILTPICLTKE